MLKIENVSLLDIVSAGLRAKFGDVPLYTIPLPFFQLEQVTMQVISAEEMPELEAFLNQNGLHLARIMQTCAIKDDRLLNVTQIVRHEASEPPSATGEAPAES